MMVLHTWTQPAMDVVRVAEPPQSEGVFALAPVMLLLVLVMVYSAIRHRRHRKTRAGVLANLAFGIAMGNALSELNTMLDPGRPQVVQMQRAEPEPCDVGDGRDPTATATAAPASELAEGPSPLQL